MQPDVDDALDAMSKRDLERLKSKLERRLQECILDGSDGAIAVRCTTKVGKNSAEFALLLCPACIEKHRLPESRAEV